MNKVPKAGLSARRAGLKGRIKMYVIIDSYGLQYPYEFKNYEDAKLVAEVWQEEDEDGAIYEVKEETK